MKFKISYIYLLLMSEQIDSYIGLILNLTMTRQITPAICDLDGKPITSEESYTLDISKKNSVKGQFIKGKNKMDICHECFMKFVKSGYQPEWITLVKNESSGKWETR